MTAYWDRSRQLHDVLMDIVRNPRKHASVSGRNLAAMTVGLGGDIGSLVPGAERSVLGNLPTSDELVERFGGDREHFSYWPSALLAPGPGEAKSLAAFLAAGPLAKVTRMYHGTPNMSFDRFDVSKSNPHDPDDVVNGIWFTSRANSAKSAGDFPYGRPNAKESRVIEADITLQNPATRTDVTKAAKEAAQRLADGADGTLQNVTREILTDKGFDGFVRTNIKIDKAKFLKQGRITLDDGRYLVDMKNEWPGGVDLFDADGSHITGYLDIDDAAKQLDEKVIIVFDEKAIKRND